MRRYASFREFYPFYLAEHADRNCRRLHFAGSTLVLVTIVAAVVAREPGRGSGSGFDRGRCVC